MRITTTLLLAACAPAAIAQDGLVVGVDDPTVDVQVYQGGSWNTLFSGADVWGLAAVNAEQRIYFNTGSTLSYWSSGTGIVNVGTITDETGATLSLVSLTYNPNDDFLYATRNIANEAVYRVNRATGVASVVDDYVDADFDFGGLGYDSVTGQLYGVNDDATPNGTGLFEFPGGAPSLISAYPAGETDIDGLAVYNNIAYLVTDQPGNFYSIDVTNPGAGYTAFANPWATSEIFSGATVAEWLIPAPGTGAVLALGGIVALRRRR